MLDGEGTNIKRLVKFKQKLEKKIQDIEYELNELRDLLEVVNLVLLDKGFKKINITKEPTNITYEEATPLKTISGELLATLYMSENSLRAVLAEDKHFTIIFP